LEVVLVVTAVTRIAGEAIRSRYNSVVAGGEAGAINGGTTTVAKGQVVHYGGANTSGTHVNDEQDGR